MAAMDIVGRTRDERVPSGNLLTRFLKRLVWRRGFLRDQLKKEVYYELHLGLVRLRSRLDPVVLMKRRRLLKMKKVKLNLGCGRRVVPDWVNLDGWYHPGLDLVMDIRCRLPFAANSTAFIFTEHTLEHLTYEEAELCLRECYRILEPKGAIRIGVPDVKRFIESYYINDSEFFLVASPGLRRTEAVNKIFIYDSHKFMYDYETLERLVRTVGFTNIYLSNYGGTRFCEFRDLDRNDPKRIAQTLYAEAVK